MKDEFEELRDFILEKEKENKAVLLTPEGLQTISIDDLLNQPADGILYDLNRDRATVLTYINDKKWVNDFATGLVIRRLKELADLSQKQG